MLFEVGMCRLYGFPDVGIIESVGVKCVKNVEG